MAKKSVITFKPFVQGETGAVRLRKPTTDVRGGTLKVMAGFTKANSGNHNSAECSRKAQAEGIRKGARGHFQRSCLRGMGLMKADAIKQAIASSA